MALHRRWAVCISMSLTLLNTHDGYRGLWALEGVRCRASEMRFRVLEVVEECVKVAAVRNGETRTEKKAAMNL